MQTYVYTKTCSQMLKEVLLIIAKKCLQPKCSPTEEWVNRTWNTMYLAKKNVMKYWHMLHMDDLWKHGKWKKPDIKGHTLNDSVFVKWLEQANL